MSSAVINEQSHSVLSWTWLSALIALSLIAIIALNRHAEQGQTIAEPDDTVTCPQPAGKRPLDCSGKARVGIASFYADRFGGRTMADGTPMRLGGDNAASLTMPLGTTARVTNLDTGKSAVVTVRDRGPYVAHRLVDLSPATARKIGISRKQGLARVQIAPIKVPMPDGSTHFGEGAF